jgi:mRNA interferase RelE/StbE
MTYSIELKPAAFRSLAKLPREARRQLRLRIDSLAMNPFPPGVKKLEGEKDLFRIRAGDYRVVYQVRKKVLVVLVIGIGHRKDIYRNT